MFGGKFRRSLSECKKLPSEFLEYQQSIDMDPQSLISSNITDSGLSESSELPSSMQDSLTSLGGGPISYPNCLNTQPVSNTAELGHSRNSSNTSQVSNF